jgi:hypothetical protein
MRIMSRLNWILKLVIKCWLNRWLSQQIRKLVWQWSLDYHISSHKWNAEGSTWNNTSMIEF